MTILDQLTKVREHIRLCEKLDTTVEYHALAKAVGWQDEPWILLELTSKLEGLISGKMTAPIGGEERSPWKRVVRSSGKTYHWGGTVGHEESMKIFNDRPEIKALYLRLYPNHPYLVADAT